MYYICVAKVQGNAYYFEKERENNKKSKKKRDESKENVKKRRISAPFEKQQTNRCKILRCTQTHGHC